MSRPTLPIVCQTPLSDGSVMVVEQTGHASSLISRYVDGVCVWGQAFARGTADDHEAQVDVVCARMVAEPARFVRYPGLA